MNKNKIVFQQQEEVAFNQLKEQIDGCRTTVEGGVHTTVTLKPPITIVGSFIPYNTGGIFSLNNDQLYSSYPNIWAISFASGNLELNMADNDSLLNRLNLYVPIVYGVKVAFAAVYTLNERIFYINGSEVGRRSVKLEGDAIFRYLYLGNRSYREVESGDNTFNTFRIFNYALSQSEVTQLYNNGKPEEYVLPSGMKELSPLNYNSIKWIKGVQISSSNIIPTEINNTTASFVGLNTGELTTNNTIIFDARYVKFPNRTGVFKMTLNLQDNGTNESSYKLYHVGLYSTSDTKEIPLSVNLGMGDNVIYVNSLYFLANNGWWNYIYYDLNKKVDITISIKIESVGCIAEYLPQNLITAHDGQMSDITAIKWLDSAKQLPINDQYLPPLRGSIGEYDLTANGTPEIVYKSNNNQVVSKQNAVIGDLVVFDKYDSKTKIVRGYTVNKDELDTFYTPIGVIYKVDTDNNTLDIVSLDNISNSRWAASYEVMLSGFDLINGGTFILTIGGINYTFTYSSGTISDISTQINSTLVSNELNTTNKGGWVAAVFNSNIVLASNTSSQQGATISVVSGVTITRTADDKNYQTTLTGLLIDGSTEFVRRNNRVNSYFAGCNLAKFLQYYSANGSTPTSNIPVGSSTIVNKTSFEESEFCADLRAKYNTYADYLYGEHLLQYPPTYGAGLRDGKTNTSLVGNLTFTDIRGNNSPCYPAIYSALNYGVSISSLTTGYEKGNWWLPSVKEQFELMRDRAYSSATLATDPVNTTLVRMSKATCYGNGYYPWTSCECNSDSAFIFGGGIVSNSSKYSAASVRPVIKIKIND